MSPPNYAIADLAARVGGVLLASDWLNPLAVPLAALAFFYRSQRRLVRWLAGYALFLLAAWWLLTHRIDRFWVPVLPVVSLLAGIGATWKDGRTWRWALAAWLAVGLSYDFVVLGSGVVADSRWFVALESLRAAAQQLRPAHVRLDKLVPPGKRVLLVGDATPFDLRASAIYNTVFDSSILEQLARDRSPAELAGTLDELGIAYVYVDWAEVARYKSPGNYGFTPFVEPAVFARLEAAGVLEKVEEDARGDIYRVVKPVDQDPDPAGRHPRDGQAGAGNE